MADKNKKDAFTSLPKKDTPLQKTAKEDRFQSVLRDIFKWEEDLKETEATTPDKASAEPANPLYKPLFADAGDAKEPEDPQVHTGEAKGDEGVSEPEIETPYGTLFVDEEPSAPQVLATKKQAPEVKETADKEPTYGTLFADESDVDKPQVPKESASEEEAETEELVSQPLFEPVFANGFLAKAPQEPDVPAEEDTIDEPINGKDTQDAHTKQESGVDEPVVVDAKEKPKKVPFFAKQRQPKVQPEESYDLHAVHAEQAEKAEQAETAENAQPAELAEQSERLEQADFDAEEPPEHSEPLHNEDQKQRFKKESRTPSGFFATSTWQNWLRPIAVLGAVCLVASLLLGLAQMITLPFAEQNSQKHADEIRRELMSAADSFDELKMDPMPADVTAVYEAKDKEKKLVGYIIEAQGMGYGGLVPASVAFDLEGNMLGVRFLDNDETPGLGQKVITDADFREQFVVKAVKEMTLDEIDAIGGATLSSMAGLNAVNAAIACYKQLVDTGEEEAPAYTLPDDVLASLWPSASSWQPLQVNIPDIMQAFASDDGIYVVVAKGKGISDIYAAVALDAEGTIVGLWLDTSKETEGLGKEYGSDEAYKGQYIGQKNADGVDTVAKATLTTKGIKDTVNKAVAALPTVKEAPPITKLSCTLPITAGGKSANAYQRRRSYNG